MKPRIFLTLLIGLAMLVTGASSAWALASEDIMLTVTIQVLSVDVEDNAVGVGNAWALGTVVGGTTCESWQAAPVAYTAAPAAWQDGVSVTNDGNGQETMGLQVAASGAWVSDTAGNDNNTADADDEYIYRALFDTAGTVGAATFGSDDRVDSAAVTKAEDDTVGTNAFTDTNADAEDMPPDPAAGSTQLLFVQFVVPATTAEAIPTQHTVTLTISAETTY